MSNKIIKPQCKIHLKSLACDVKIKVRLEGDSSLFIISRNSGTIEVYSPVVKITRDTSLKGLFVIFGYVDPSSQKFYFSKQLQIPEETELQPETKNYRELEVNFCDNGDDRIYLTVASFGKFHPIKQFVTYCDSFLPYFKKSNILIGGNGDSVLIKNVSIQQRERNKNKIPVRNQDCCCLIY